MKVNEDNFIAELQRGNERALEYVIVSTDVYKTDNEGNVTEEVPMGIPIGDVYINGRNAAKSAGGGARYKYRGECNGNIDRVSFG